MKFAEPKSRRPWSEVLAELEARHRAQRGPRWHLVQCAPGERDRHACEWLTRLGYEVYYPMERLMQRAARKRLSHAQRKARLPVMRERLRPFFPRYVFTRFDIRDGKWREIFGVAGVTGMVCEHDMPVPIADSLIEALRANEVGGAIPAATPAAAVFRTGALVRVTDGPLAPFQGAIEKIRTRTIDGVDFPTRLIVAVSIFGRLTPSELDVWQVEALNAPR